MQTLPRTLIALHFRKLQLWFSGFSTVIVSLLGGYMENNLSRLSRAFPGSPTPATRSQPRRTARERPRSPRLCLDCPVPPHHHLSRSKRGDVSPSPLWLPRLRLRQVVKIHCGEWFKSVDARRRFIPMHFHTRHLP